MRITTRWLLQALALAPAATAYADYSWELAGRLATGEADDSVTSLDSEELAASATYFFDAVADGNGPPALAAFFDPASRVSLSVSQEEQTSRASLVPGTAPIVADLERSDYSLGGQYLLPQSKWYFGGRFARADLDSPPRPPPLTESAGDLRAHGVVAGKYLGASGATRLQLALDRTTIENDISITICIPGCFNGTGSAETATDEVTLGVKHVRRLRSLTYALSGTLSEADTQASFRTPVFTGLGGLLPPIQGGTVVELDAGTVRGYSAAAELYPIPSVGVRLSLTRIDGANLEGDTVELGTSWFFRRHVALELSLSRDDFNDPASDMDRAALRVIGRF